MLEEVRKVREQALQDLDGVASLRELEGWRIRYLGRGGSLTRILRSIGELPSQERPLVGQAANRARAELEEALRSREAQLKVEELGPLKEERIDVTLPGRPISLGRLHISTQTLREIYAIFADMGFQIVEGPEVETDLYNFQLLNMPPDHPARDMWSTLYIDERRLLRTHTSPGQIHVMRRYCPEPIRVILPGKVYRHDAVSARYEFMFYHVEGLAIGHHITMADLKGVLTAFAQQMFGEERRARFRCSYFPFTEPSAEIDMDCILCGGEGCRVCRHSGWVEILGSGMVHPQVLENGGYDPKVFSGFAFGMGLERIAMLKHRIDDIRHFYANDLRFLSQFG